MTPLQFQYFDTFRKEFKEKIRQWSRFSDQLISLQTEAAKGKNGETDYSVQNAVVYNTALEDVTEADDIRLILIGDNPGKNEQLDENKRYLVGLAGKLGVKFFAENPELKTDFRKNVIILNKTPVHSARTEQLKFIIKNGGPEIAELIDESQKWMAQKTAELHLNLAAAAEKEGGVIPQLWLVGYAELKNKGLFTGYRDTLVEVYKNHGKLDFCKDNVLTFQHFSMNRFTIDLNDFKKKQKATAPDKASKDTSKASSNSGTSDTTSLSETLRELGSLHRQEVFGV